MNNLTEFIQHNSNTAFKKDADNNRYIKQIKKDIFRNLKKVQFMHEDEATYYFIYHAIKVKKYKETGKITILDASKNVYEEIGNKFILFLINNYICIER